MIRLKIVKEQVENFIESLRSDFKRLKSKQIKEFWFNKFKKYFCDDRLVLNGDYIWEIKDEKEIKVLKKIYDNISMSSSEFWKKIRDFIIVNFTQYIKFCPYCGKVPLIYFEKDKWYKRLFQLDHFFPKDSFHIGIINFFNLIPVCNACNHLKGDKYNPIKILKEWWKVFHPYFGYLYLDWKEIKKLEKDYVKFDFVNFLESIEIEKTIVLFNFLEKYLHDEETYNIFSFIYDKYTKIKDEYCRFKQTSKLVKEFVNYFFKNYYPEKEEEILKYSNWKFKKDLIEYMEKILEDDLEKKNKNKNKNYNLAWY